MKKRTEPAKVNMSGYRIKQYHYDALQRWMAYHHMEYTPALVLAIESLPGIAPILQEEKEAYARSINQGHQEIKDFIIDVHHDTDNA